MKLYIYITDIEAALKGDFRYSVTASSADNWDDRDTHGLMGYTLLDVVEVDAEIDRESMTKRAVEDIEKDIQEVRAKTEAAITQLEGRKQNLLALTDEGAA